MARRALLGIVICGVLAALVPLSGVDRLLPLERVVPPAVPDAWAPQPLSGSVEVTLVSPPDLVDGIAAGLGESEVALHRGGAVALVDGRVFAASAATARNALHVLAWDGLPIRVQQSPPGDLALAAPGAAPLVWRAHRRAHRALHVARDFVAGYPAFSFTVVLLGLCWGVFALRTPYDGRRLPVGPATAAADPPGAAPVRVVLVPDHTTLDQVRVAIGEDHVVAGTRDAFAFADGWILAVRKGSVFELMSEMGWRSRPIRITSREALAGEGHRVSAVPGDDAADTLGLLDALHVCGPLAHGEAPRLASGAASPA